MSNFDNDTEVRKWSLKGPHRKVNVVIKMSGDSHEDIIHGFHELSRQFRDRKEILEPQIRTGSGGWIIWVTHDPEMTKERYEVELQAYIEEHENADD